LEIVEAGVVDCARFSPPPPRAFLNLPLKPFSFFSGSGAGAELDKGDGRGAAVLEAALAIGPVCRGVEVLILAPVPVVAFA
jgi:hypothetical protein